MKIKQNSYVRIVATIGIILLSIVPLRANPIAPNPFVIVLPIYFIIFMFTVLTEFLVARIILRKEIKKGGRLFLAIFIIHLITFPITQLVALGLLSLSREIFFIGMNPFVVYLAEIIPYVAEYYLLRWQLNKLEQKGFIVSSVLNKKILITSVAMNTVTFVSGLIVFGVFYHEISSALFYIAGWVNIILGI